MNAYAGEIGVEFWRREDFSDQTDGAGELFRRPLQTFLNDQGTSDTTTITNSSQMNSQAGRSEKTVKNASLTTLRAAKFPNSFWYFALVDAIDKHNFLIPQKACFQSF